MCCTEQRTNARHYVSGLLSDLASKDAESIAYLHDRERQGIQKFIGRADWDHKPLVAELARQVGQQLGDADGVLVFDPSSFAKYGTESAGVARQWCGRLGKIDNCQVAVYLGYVSRVDHALVDFRLYLPREWTNDRKRRDKAGVPWQVRFATPARTGPGHAGRTRRPAAALVGRRRRRDGRAVRGFASSCRPRGETYLLAVPGNTLVRDLAAADPPYGGRGRRPLTRFVRADRWCSAAAEEDWQTIEVRDGEKGPLVVQAVWTLVQARSEGKPSDVAESLVVFREQQSDGSFKHDYLLANAIPSNPLEEFARVYKAEHQIEDLPETGQERGGPGRLSGKDVEGWHHHQCLSLLATWFLTQETRRGKNPDAGADGAASTSADGGAAQPVAQGSPSRANPPHGQPTLETQRASPALSLEATQTLAASAL
ncbi:MAG: IS701 family transposase [Gemmataceae bacterium]